MLSINNLHVSVADKAILKGLSLTIKPGEVHAIMGPNGAGKSTLGYVLAGRDGYTVEQGSVSYKDKNLFDLSIEERARDGLFLALQYPVEVPGVSNIYFLRAAVNAMRKARGEEELDAMDFITLVKSKLKELKMDEKFLYRDINVGFSGGEKKRNEILQLALLEPDLVILDETDSGLDIDALRIVAEGVNALRNEKRSFIVITHYQRLLDYIKPDVVHVLANGVIIKSGSSELAHELEKTGYAQVANK